MGECGQVHHLLRDRHRPVCAVGHCGSGCVANTAGGDCYPYHQVGGHWHRPCAAGNGFREDAHFSRAGVPRHGLYVCGAGYVDAFAAGSVSQAMSAMSMSAQLINLMAALMLLIAFAMLAQRRILSLIYLFAWQGGVLAVNSLIVAWYTGHNELYLSAFFTVLLKVIALPMALHYLIRKLNIKWD